MQAKADLHLHTKFSDRPSEWFLRRIGSPESFTEPMELYRICKARGMSFVTVSDHNCIDGALSLAHLPDTFISCEVTTYFPEDGCKVHILVTGITPEQFKDIQQARQSIYDLHRYVLEQDIITSVAHMFYSVNGRLTVDHIERLILMFQRFEGLNGTVNRLSDQMTNSLLRHLSPQMMTDMANRQNLAPTGPEPWRKCFTGGSDDHSGLYLGNAYTVTPPAANVEQFLDHLRRGEHEMAGVSGTSLRVAHAFYQIGYGYYRQRYLQSGSGGLIGEVFKRLAPQPAAGGPRHSRLRRTVSHNVRRVAWSLVKPFQRRRMSETDRLLLDELAKFLGLDEHQPVDPAQVQDLGIDQKNFATACRICHHMGFRFLSKLGEEIKKGRLEGSMQALMGLGPVALAFTPYFAAFKNIHKDRWLREAAGAHFATVHHLRMPHDRRAWVAPYQEADQPDAGDDMTLRMRALFTHAKKQKHRVLALTCRGEKPRRDYEVKNFDPVGFFTMPELAGQKFAFPPFLDIIRFIEMEEISELYLSHPDPMGLAVLAAGKMLGLRVTGIYHGDGSERVFKATKDEMFEDLARTLVRWFYGKMDQVLVPDSETRMRLIDQGYDAGKLRVLAPIAPGAAISEDDFNAWWDPFHGRPTPADLERMLPYTRMTRRTQARPELLEVG